MKSRGLRSLDQPRPRIPGLSRGMVRGHAARLFRDVMGKRPLTAREWRLAEQDLARKLESEGL